MHATEALKISNKYAKISNNLLNKIKINAKKGLSGFTFEEKISGDDLHGLALLGYKVHNDSEISPQIEKYHYFISWLG